jgi:hypothetical protein
VCGWGGNYSTPAAGHLGQLPEAEVQLTVQHFLPALHLMHWFAAVGDQKLPAGQALQLVASLHLFSAARLHARQYSAPGLGA